MIECNRVINADGCLHKFSPDQHKVDKWKGMVREEGFMNLRFGDHGDK